MNKVIATCLMLLFSSHICADEKSKFSEWLKQFKQESLQAGISKKTINATFKTAKYIPRIIELDRAQPEFITPFLSYIDKRLDANTVNRGRDLLQQHQAMLNDVEAKYGVPKTILVSFWGMETHYGNVQGSFALPSALMTLAYDGRRTDFFRTELLNLMQIIQEHHQKPSNLRGSWAGAMGHMQFMPSTYLKHGVDADNNGRIDIWRSLPDAFASAANYLAKVGWRANEPVALQVTLPLDFDYSQAQYKKRKSVMEWAKLGVNVPEQWAHLENTAILLPQGWQGPAFMVFSNFDVVMDWNRSVNYALAVSLLADQYSEEITIKSSPQVEVEAVSFNQMWALQGRLNELGYDCGAPDGFPGLKTQEAIRLYQATQQLPQDGYASPSLYHRLLNN